MGRLYDTVEWRRLRMVKLAHDPLCEVCIRRGRHVPATEVDHVVAVARGGGALDLENCRSVCKPCHSAKTAEVDGAFGNARRERQRVRGCDVNGIPLDPAHPWNETSRDREAQTPCANRRVRFPGF